MWLTWRMGHDAEVCPTVGDLSPKWAVFFFMCLKQDMRELGGVITTSQPAHSLPAQRDVSAQSVCP